MLILEFQRETNLQYSYHHLNNFLGVKPNFLRRFLQNMKKQTSLNDSPESQSNHEIKNDLDFIRDAYQTLPQMIVFEGQKPWNALSVFIQLSFKLAAFFRENITDSKCLCIGNSNMLKFQYQ